MRVECCIEIAKQASTDTGVLGMREKYFASTQDIGFRAAERRLSVRLRLQVPMFVRGTDAYGEDFIELAKTLDISASGAHLTVPRAVRKMAMVTLTVPAPSISTSGLVPASMEPIQARVVRQKQVGDVHMIGVQFMKPLA